MCTLFPQAVRQSELWSKYRFICCCGRCNASPLTYVDHTLQVRLWAKRCTIYLSEFLDVFRFNLGPCSCNPMIYFHFSFSYLFQVFVYVFNPLARVFFFFLVEKATFLNIISQHFPDHYPISYNWTPNRPILTLDLDSHACIPQLFNGLILTIFHWWYF